MIEANSTIEYIFEKHFKGEKNFVTPLVVEYGAAGKNLIYEISKGKMFSDDWLYGVTVLRVTEGNKTIHEHDLCKSFNTISKARTHAKNLKNY